MNDLIDFELSVMNQGLTPEQGRKIHSILYENLSRDDNLSLFGKYNNQFTESQRDHRDRYSINIDIIKKNFSRKLKRNRGLKNKIVHELKRNGIPTDIIKKFRREPAILHPKNTTLRQMEALRSREENLSGLLLLREVLSSRENSTKDKKMRYVPILCLCRVTRKQK